MGESSGQGSQLVGQPAGRRPKATDTSKSSFGKEDSPNRNGEETIQTHSPRRESGGRKGRHRGDDHDPTYEGRAEL
jgi:hypothetical protein